MTQTSVKTLTGEVKKIVNDFINKAKGVDGVTVFNNTVNLPEGKYTGKLNVKDDKPVLIIRELTASQARLCFINMKVSDMDGRSLGNKNVSYNDTFEKTLTSPEAWDKGFPIEVVNSVTASGMKYQRIQLILS